MTREDTFARLDFAQESWTAALEAHWSAPPAAGFAERLMHLANAADELSNAFRFADRETLPWTPLANASAGLHPPPELSPDFNRPGPRELWRRFDETVDDFGLALESVSGIRVAQALERMSECLRELSHANRPQDSPR